MKKDILTVEKYLDIYMRDLYDYEGLCYCSYADMDSLDQKDGESDEDFSMRKQDFWREKEITLEDALKGDQPFYVHFEDTGDAEVTRFTPSEMATWIIKNAKENNL